MSDDIEDDEDGVHYPYSATTRRIRVLVAPMFLEAESTPEDGRYVWAYHVRLENHGAIAVQLLTRHWVITDANGRTQEVRGDGVVGEQPVLQPGEAYEYTSGCPLATPSGIMHGSYGMVDSEGETFNIAIPAFSLDSDYGDQSVN